MPRDPFRALIHGAMHHEGVLTVTDLFCDAELVTNSIIRQAMDEGLTDDQIADLITARDNDEVTIYTQSGTTWIVYDHAMPTDRDNRWTLAAWATARSARVGGAV